MLDPTDRINYFRIVVERLARSVDRGECDVDEIDAHYRLATKREDLTDERRDVLVAIDLVERYTIADYRGAGLLPVAWAADGSKIEMPIADETVRWLVCSYVRNDAVVERLRQHAAEVAIAVRAWSNRGGRPRKNVPRVDKWEAVAAVLNLAGLGPITAKATEQLWKEHAPKKWRSPSPA